MRKAKPQKRKRPAPKKRGSAKKRAITKKKNARKRKGRKGIFVDPAKIETETSGGSDAPHPSADKSMGIDENDFQDDVPHEQHTDEDDAGADDEGYF
jgi:hypothetical protein